MKLGTKIIIIAIIPLVLFMIVSGILLTEQYKSFQESRQTLINVEVLESTTALIDELQVERGLTTNYMSLNADYKKMKDGNKGKPKLKERIDKLVATLTEQRDSFVADEVQSFKEKLANAYIKDETKAAIVAELDGLTALREESENGKRSEVFNKYTKTISDLMNIYSLTAKITEISTISAKVKTAHILENAKESAAQLRASLVNILTINKAIEEQDFNFILGIKAAIDSNLNSPVLEMDTANIESVKGFVEQDHWKKTTEIFQVVLRNADFGLFNEDPAAFNKTATLVLNDIANVASNEFATLKKMLDRLISNASKLLMIIGGINLAVIVILLIYTVMAIRSITTPLNQVISELLGFADDVQVAVSELDKSSTVLTESANNTTRAVQQVGASTDEISAMLKNTFESSTQALNNVEDGQENSRVGTNVMSDLGKAMEDIQAANEDLKELENVILEIGAKTSVINDIVFETRLLSFNASIEAARAGQHGKGFAVVAEEVGNLAKMSGDAADTIANLIKQSTEKVNETIAKTTDRIAQSQEISDKCTEVFHKISTNVDELAIQINAITTAAKEQEIGINEVGKAMKEVDEITMTNTSSAQDTQNIAVQLKGRSEELTVSVESLEKMAYGNKG